jgi:hypothetical protein
MTNVLVPEPQQFDTIISAHAGKPHVYVLVSAEKNQDTGVSWCPDCVAGICFGVVESFQAGPVGLDDDFFSLLFPQHSRVLAHQGRGGNPRCGIDICPRGQGQVC